MKVTRGLVTYFPTNQVYVSAVVKSYIHTGLQHRRRAASAHTHRHTHARDPGGRGGGRRRRTPPGGWEAREWGPAWPTDPLGEGASYRDERRTWPNVPRAIWSGPGDTRRRAAPRRRRPNRRRTLPSPTRPTLTRENLLAPPDLS